jgi:tetratricopeptide (TPR) repeat protein
VVGCVDVPANNPSHSTNRAYVRYAEKGQYDLAIKEIDTQLESPTRATSLYVLYNDRGEIHRWQGQYEMAVADYKKALEIKPDFYIAWNNLGLTYTGMKDYEQAITCLNKALEINPTFALTYYNRGLVYERLKENDKAADDFRKAKELGYTRAEDYNGKRTKF